MMARLASAGLCAVVLAACGRAAPATTTGAAPRANAPLVSVPPPAGPNAPESRRRGAGLAIGLTESNPNLIWSAGARAQAPAGFAAPRRRVAALRLDYLRVLVDWAKLQPDAVRPAALAATQDGCERGVGPCAPFAGLRDLFAAIASNPQLVPVVVIYGAPSWAALPAGGCERPGTLPSARALAPAATTAYRSLIRSLISLARSVGLELPWWGPWNEPNHPYFISPQRAGCDAHAPAVAPLVYARLAAAMGAALAADGRPHRLVLGDLAGFTSPSRFAATVGEFVAGLPKALVCAGGAWAVHYGLAGLARRAQATVDALERALAARRCASLPRIWVTEAGAPTARGAPLAYCRELAGALAHWNADPRVDAVFQYTFREDPLFRLGLADVGLTRSYPAYAVWHAWGARAPGDPPPATGRLCG